MMDEQHFNGLSQPPMATVITASGYRRSARQVAIIDIVLSIIGLVFNVVFVSYLIRDWQEDVSYVLLAVAIIATLLLSVGIFFSWSLSKATAEITNLNEAKAKAQRWVNYNIFRLIFDFLSFNLLGICFRIYFIHTVRKFIEELISELAVVDIMRINSPS